MTSRSGLLTSKHTSLLTGDASNEPARRVQHQTFGECFAPLPAATSSGRLKFLPFLAFLPHLPLHVSPFPGVPATFSASLFFWRSCRLPFTFSHFLAFLPRILPRSHVPVRVEMRACTRVRELSLRVIRSLRTHFRSFVVCVRDCVLPVHVSVFRSISAMRVMIRAGLLL